MCKKSLAELTDADKKAFYVEVQVTAREEGMKEVKKKRKREKEEASKNKKMRIGDVDKLRNAMMGGGLRRPGKDQEEKKEEFGKTAADQAEEPLSVEEEDLLVKLTRDAAFRILMQLEKRRAMAEKVFVENEKRAKVAQNQLKEKLKEDEKVEKDWNTDRCCDSSTVNTPSIRNKTCTRNETCTRTHVHVPNFTFEVAW